MPPVAIADLPSGVGWPINPDMEIGMKLGIGLTRQSKFSMKQNMKPKWQERWPVFAGPTLHYGSERW
ncbi:MAG TPA: DUF6662 family protein [Gammaproteobacteria bacterium]|nr:DUF6662 family protein [Gammaproteobacteria bacterium]